MKKRIGFFGGCFNPVTNAHIQSIQKVIAQENLSKVYFVPMGDMYAKKDMIPFSHRLKMLEISLEKEEKMEILAISNQDRKMHAIDTFQVIDQKFPKAERFFIMGSDNYKRIGQWEQADNLLKNYNYIILDREKGEMKDISSSVVRQKVKQKENIEQLVPKGVRKYIEQKNLYK